MQMLTVRRSNGDAICGPMRTVIARNEHDFDAARTNEPADDGPYRHTFELYATLFGDLVFVVTFLDHGHPRYRHGQRFHTLGALRDFLERYDPCQYLSLSAAGDVTIRHSLSRCYAYRRDDFLRAADSRLGEQARV